MCAVRYIPWQHFPKVERMKHLLIALLMLSQVFISARSEVLLPTDAELQAEAVRGLRWAFYAPNGYRWEYSGALLLHDGELTHSASSKTLVMLGEQLTISAPLFTLHKVDAADMAGPAQLASGDVLVGLYHTHPCVPDVYFSQYFSPQDLIAPRAFHVPAFILDECTGLVHEFDPQLDQVEDSADIRVIVRRDGSSRRVLLPKGRLVGDIGDRGPNLTQLIALFYDNTP
jgi:hypothetical protein